MKLISQRLREEAAKWSGTACRTEEQFELKELLNEAATALERHLLNRLDEEVRTASESARTECKLGKEHCVSPECGGCPTAPSAPVIEGLREIIRTLLPLPSAAGLVANARDAITLLSVPSKSAATGETPRTDAVAAEYENPMALHGLDINNVWLEMRQLERELAEARQATAKLAADYERRLDQLPPRAASAMRVKDRREIVGTMEFMRSKPPSDCICCEDGKEKGHIFGRGLRIEPQEAEFAGITVKHISDWLHDRIAAMARDGDSVRVSVEVCAPNAVDSASDRK